MDEYCIVGAGPSGLTLAYELLRAGKRVCMVERDLRAGGLSKSFNYDGHIFDIGPKKFHTYDPIVTKFILDILRNNVRKIKKDVKLHFAGKYFTWPLKPTDIFRMPPEVGIGVFSDCLKNKAVTDKDSYHEFIRARYGETLYRLFFAPYTEKFLCWNPEEIHADWAKMSIDRTVLEKKVPVNTLTDLLAGLWSSKKIETEFLYPGNGGFGSFFDRLYDLCLSHQYFSAYFGEQFETLVETRTHLEARTDRKRTLQFQHLIWTGNLNDLTHLAAPGTAELPYLNTVFYNLVVKTAAVNRDLGAQWIYISGKNNRISRVTCMSEFLGAAAQTGYYNLICELTDSQSSPRYFNAPDQYRDLVTDELLALSLVKSRNGIEHIYANPVRDTYPVYCKNYPADFRGATQAITRFSKRIHLLGRSGAFWYNNADHSMRMAIDLSNVLLGTAKEGLNYRSYFG